MLKTSSMLVLLAAMLILAACSVADDVPRAVGPVGDDVPRVLSSVVDDVPRAVGLVGDDAIRVAREKDVALILADDVDSLLLLLQQQATELSKEQRKLQVQEGLEKAVCAYLNPSELQEAARLRIAQIAAEANVPEPDLFDRVIEVHQRVSNEEELTNLFKLYCEAKELR